MMMMMIKNPKSSKKKKKVTEIAAEDLLVKALQATSVTSSFRKQTGQNDVLGWWLRLLSESRSTYFSMASKADLTGSKVERQVLLRARGASLSQTKHDWKNILVVGELNVCSGIA
ncbi:hypothetical protein I7I51_03466 [Histoplasma capsulatum]|uniref:Uncharacterized protein n=1 Tax=Ajellomyces capsulatus TaxID=5037 RepID=A0A8A1M981_AJECA|nr:hypothetical protein I7I51_03466 [Histoplasma capsulatum]